VRAVFVPYAAMKLNKPSAMPSTRCRDRVLRVRPYARMRAVSTLPHVMDDARALHRPDGLTGAAMTVTLTEQHKKVKRHDSELEPAGPELPSGARRADPAASVRDDDAIAPTPALDVWLQWPVTLTPRAYRRDPQTCRPRSGTALPRSAAVRRWSTAATHSHAPEGAKKGRVRPPRPEAAHELTKGWNRCQSLFGDDLLPIFVRRWNRLDEGCCGSGAGGYVGGST